MRKRTQNSLYKLYVLCLALVLASGIIGIGYASWHDEVNVVATITTGAWYVPDIDNDGKGCNECCDDDCDETDCDECGCYDCDEKDCEVKDCEEEYCCDEDCYVKDNSGDNENDDENENDNEDESVDNDSNSSYNEGNSNEDYNIGNNEDEKNVNNDKIENIENNYEESVNNTEGIHCDQSNSDLNDNDIDSNVQNDSDATN